MQEILQRLGAFWSDNARAFIAHWAGLRGDALVPTTETFFDHPEPQFAPSIYVVELIGENAIVRLQGEALDERWTANLTGKDLHHGLSMRVRGRSLSNMRKVVSYPCGCLARNIFMTSRNRDITADLVLLPLSVQGGRPPRVVGLSLVQRDSDWDETVARFSIEGPTWLDIGAGVPADPPLDLIDSPTLGD